MANVLFEFDMKDNTWFTDNQGYVLKSGEPVYFKDSNMYFIGDGITPISDLNPRGIITATGYWPLAGTTSGNPADGPIEWTSLASIWGDGGGSNISVNGGINLYADFTTDQNNYLIVSKNNIGMAAYNPLPTQYTELYLTNGSILSQVDDTFTISNTNPATLFQINNTDSKIYTRLPIWDISNGNYINLNDSATDIVINTANAVFVNSLYTTIGASGTSISYFQGAVELYQDAVSNMQAVTLQQLIAHTSGIYNLRGGYNASSNLYPSTGGSGTSGAIKKADVFVVTTGGILGGTPVVTGDQLTALVDTPGQTAANWNIVSHDLGYSPEDAGNKATSFSVLNNTLYPTTQAVANYITSLGFLTGNQTITLTGDVTGSGSTSITTTIGAGKVTNAMLAGSIPTSLTDAKIKGTVATGQVLVGSATDTASGSANFTYASGILKVNANLLPTGESYGVQLGAQIATLGDKSQNNAPTYFTFLKGDGLGNAQALRATVGFMGTTEMNMGVNFKYDNGIHDYFDNTKAAIWSYMGYTNGWGLQYVPANNPYSAGVLANDIFTKYGCVPFKVEYYNQPATGKGIDGFSKLTTARIELANSSDTSTVANDKTTFENVAGVLTTKIGTTALMTFAFASGLTLNQQNATVILERSGNTGANTGAIYFKSNGTFLAYFGVQRADNSGFFAGITANAFCFNSSTNDMFFGNDTYGPQLSFRGGNWYFGAATAASEKIQTNGNIYMDTVGKGLKIKGGTNARIGESTLSGGTVTVSNTSVTANTLVFLTRRVAGAAMGNLTYSVSAGTSFTITSDNGSDSGTIEWLLIEKM